MGPLIGVFLAALVSLSMLAHLQPLQNNGLDQTRMAATGQQFAQVLDAAQAYTTAHSQTLASSVPVGGSSSVSLSALQNDGLLPGGFTGLNPFGQQWQVQVGQPSSGNLQTVVTSTGGTQMTGKQEAFVASIAGARGGFIPYASMLGNGNPATAQGAYGSWSMSMAPYANPGAGHAAGLATFTTNNGQNNYLYRVAVSGHPELNTMSTGLNMGSNSISNANDMQGNTATLAGGNPNGRPGGLQVGSAYVYGDSSNLALRQSGDVYLQHSNDGSAANLHAGLIGAAGKDPSSGLPSGWTGGLHTVDVYADQGTVAAGSGGNVAASLSANGDIYGSGKLSISGASNLNGKVTVGNEVQLPTNIQATQPCSDWGAITGSSRAGEILVCFHGIWTNSAAGAFQTFYQLPKDNTDAVNEDIGPHFGCWVVETPYNTTFNGPVAGYIGLGATIPSDGLFHWTLVRGANESGGTVFCTDYN